MVVNPIFELSMMLNAEHFQRVLARASKSGVLKEAGDEYTDLSMAAKGITVLYRDSRYKKRVRLIVNTYLLLDDISDTDKLLRKLDKRITEYFDHKFRLDDFALCGANLVVDINAGSRTSVSNYLKVIRRVGKVKGFSPVSYDGLSDSASFCLSGNSSGIDFLLYDLEDTVKGQLTDADIGRKKVKSASEQAKGVLRVEVRLTKPKAIRDCTDAVSVSGQIAPLVRNCQNIFMDAFARIIPFGDFYKKDQATEIIQRDVKDTVMKRKMLRLLALIPEKKSLHLAQKAMNCRDVEKVMDAFAKTNLSPVTISKRHDVKKLKSLYSYFMDS